MVARLAPIPNSAGGGTCRGLGGRTGSLAPGMAADFAVMDAPDVDHWLYHFRPNACRLTVQQGRAVWRAT